MSALIAWICIVTYLLQGKPELIIAAGLFGIASEVKFLADRFMGGVE